ncbi:hypothetical protein MTO96_009144 [Rhipicephalus appendiculatus]
MPSAGRAFSRPLERSTGIPFAAGRSGVHCGILASDALEDREKTSPLPIGCPPCERQARRFCPVHCPVVLLEERRAPSRGSHARDGWVRTPVRGRPATLPSDARNPRLGDPL